MVLGKVKQTCNLILARLPGASEYHDGKRFILLARLGKLPCHKKLGIFKFMFSLSDTFFIVHVLDSNVVFCAPKLDLRQYNVAI